MADKVRLTTIDNPFNPFTQFDEWFKFDEEAGYHSSSVLARLIHTSSELSEADQEEANSWAVSLMVDEDPLGIYIKVFEPKAA